MPCKTRTVKGEATLNHTVTPGDWSTYFEALDSSTIGDEITTYLFTYLLHGAESFFRS
jgi:hypothetical protein